MLKRKAVMYIEPHGFTLTLKDGEEVICDVSSESVMKNISIGKDGVKYNDTLVDDVFDLEDEGHYDPYEWFIGNASPFYMEEN